MSFLYVGTVSDSTDFVNKVYENPKIIIDVLGEEISQPGKEFSSPCCDRDAITTTFRYKKDTYMVVIEGRDVLLYKQSHNVYNDGFLQWKDSTDNPKYKDRTLTGLARVGKFKFNLIYNVPCDTCRISMMFDNGSSTNEIKNLLIHGVTNEKIKHSIVDAITIYTMDVVDSALEICDF